MLEKMDNLNHRYRIGKRIAKIRMEKGISQSKLAELTGLKQQNVNRIEQGRYNTGIENISLIANALGYELDFLVKNDKE